jgi:cardiolipin synthase
MTHSEHEMMSPERFLTLSNMISVLRAAMAAPIIIFLSRNQMVLATLFIFLAIISDCLDGYIARKFNNVTLLGKALDPAADKICIFSVILFLVIKDKIPINILVILGIRDLILTMMLLYLVNIKTLVVETNYAGKISTVLITITLITYIYNMTLLQKPVVLLTYVAISIAFVQYLLIFIRNFGNRKKRLRHL